MSEKILFSINYDCRFKVDMAYIGCKMIDKNYTYNKLFMSMINNSIDSKPIIVVNNSSMRFFTFKECYDMGVDFISDCLDRINEDGNLSDITLDDTIDKLSKELSSVVPATQSRTISEVVIANTEFVDGRICICK